MTKEKLKYTVSYWQHGQWNRVTKTIDKFFAKAVLKALKDDGMTDAKIFGPDEKNERAEFVPTREDVGYYFPKSNKFDKAI